MLGGPVDQYVHAARFFGLRVGVQQQHGVGFQALGTVHGEQLHGMGRFNADRGCAHMACLERAHPCVRREKAATVYVERGG